MATTVREVWPEADHIIAVAVAGIPWAMAVAERLDLPLTYVRARPRNPGVVSWQACPARPGTRC